MLQRACNCSPQGLQRMPRSLVQIPLQVLWHSELKIARILSNQNLMHRMTYLVVQHETIIGPQTTVSRQPILSADISPGAEIWATAQWQQDEKQAFWRSGRERTLCVYVMNVPGLNDSYVGLSGIVCVTRRTKKSTTRLLQGCCTVARTAMIVDHDSISAEGTPKY